MRNYFFGKQNKALSAISLETASFIAIILVISLVVAIIVAPVVILIIALVAGMYKYKNDMDCKCRECCI